MGALEIATGLFVSERPYERMEGTAQFGAYIDVTVGALTQSPVPELKFKGRLDTAADISLVPIQIGKQLMPLLLGYPVLTRGAHGEVKRRRSHRMMLSIAGDTGSKIYRPKRGVILCDGDHGLIGMDIMKHWTVTFDGVRQTFTISIRGQSCVD